MTALVFDTLSPMTEGLPGTAPQIFSATTDNSLSDLETAGAVAGLVAKHILKAGDILFVNYNVAVSQGNGVFIVTSTSSGSLVPYLQLSASLHAAKYNNAGGSASVAITDAAISAASVVFAQVQSSANAVTVEKVTPGSGSLTVLLSGDPGASVISYLALAAVQ